MIHKNVHIGKNVKLGENVKIWPNTNVRENAQIGAGTTIGIGVYIGSNVTIGKNCKIQNFAQIYEGSEIGDGVFIGPLVVLTNDKSPRSLNVHGKIKDENDWQLDSVVIEGGASLGAGVICVAPVRIGEASLVGAGSVVTRNVPRNAVVFGNPAKFHGWVCAHGVQMEKISDTKYKCIHSGEVIYCNS